MTWTCPECGFEVVRGRVPAACRCCGATILLPKDRPGDGLQLESGPEGLFAHWLRCGLDRADLAAHPR